eukprot:m51a1_g13903 putative chromodomain y-like (256) ;mRNA; r:754270-755309
MLTYQALWFVEPTTTELNRVPTPIPVPVEPDREEPEPVETEVYVREQVDAAEPVSAEQVARKDIRKTIAVLFAAVKQALTGRVVKPESPSDPAQEKVALLADVDPSVSDEGNTTSSLAPPAPLSSIYSRGEDSVELEGLAAPVVSDRGISDVVDHTDFLLPPTPFPSSFVRTPMPTPEGSEEDEGEGEIFEVEAIVDTRKYRGARQYLVRWRGYGPASDTWEPEQNCSGCPDIVAAFWRSHPTRSSPPAKKSRKY